MPDENNIEQLLRSKIADIITELNSLVPIATAELVHEAKQGKNPPHVFKKWLNDNKIQINHANGSTVCELAATLSSYFAGSPPASFKLKINAENSIAIGALAQAIADDFCIGIDMPSNQNLDDPSQPAATPQLNTTTSATAAPTTKPVQAPKKPTPTAPTTTTTPAPSKPPRKPARSYAHAHTPTPIAPVPERRYDPITAPEPNHGKIIGGIFGGFAGVIIGTILISLSPLTLGGSAMLGLFVVILTSTLITTVIGTSIGAISDYLQNPIIPTNPITSFAAPAVSTHAAVKQNTPAPAKKPTLPPANTAATSTAAPSQPKKVQLSHYRRIKKTQPESTSTKPTGTEPTSTTPTALRK